MSLKQAYENSSTDIFNLFDNILYTFATVSVLEDDSTLSYETGKKKIVAEDDIIFVADGRYAYKVLHSESIIFDLMTKGGIKLKVLADASGGVTLAQFGWSSGDIAASLAKALRFGLVYLDGEMNLASSVSTSGDPEINLEIRSTQGSKITYSGSANTDYAMLTLNKVSSLRISGDLTLECKNTAGNTSAAVGLDVKTNHACRLVDISGLVVSAPTSALTDVAAAGIRVLSDPDYGIGEIVRIQSCTIKNVNAADAVGIEVRGFRVTSLMDNLIYKVTASTSASAASRDADGIRVESRLSLDKKLTESTVTIENNVISNCARHFIRTQTRGSASIRNNFLQFVEAIDLNANWRGISCEADGACIENNVLELLKIKKMSGQQNYILFFMRVPSTTFYDPAYDGQLIKGSLKGNRVIISKQVVDDNGNSEDADPSKYFASGFFVDLRPLRIKKYTVDFDISDNEITTTAGWAEINGTSAKYASLYAGSLEVPNDGWISGATARLSIRNNSIDAKRFMARMNNASSEMNSDLSGKLFLTIEGNNCPSPDQDAILPYNDNDCFTSSIRISDNSVGKMNNLWEAPFDFANILGGAFYIGDTVTTPRRTNGPNIANYTNALVSRNGLFLMIDMYGGNKDKRTISVTRVGDQPNWVIDPPPSSPSGEST